MANDSSNLCIINYDPKKSVQNVHFANHLRQLKTVVETTDKDTNAKTVKNDLDSKISKKKKTAMSYGTSLSLQNKRSENYQT